jgi:alpha/beta hydrolase fold
VQSGGFKSAISAQVFAECYSCTLSCTDTCTDKMASIAFPSLAKKATLSDGTTYGYVAAAPSPPSMATFLFLHGYPSSSHDWRHQIAALQREGYGVIVPDLLGYGDTDKPTELVAYRMKTMCAHMTEILDLENVPRAIAVAHDWLVAPPSSFWHRCCICDSVRIFNVVSQ